MQGFPFGAGVPPGCLGQGPGIQNNAGLMSPTRAEQGCAGVPIPPSTPSSRSPNVPMFGPQLFPNFGSHPGVGQVDLA